MLKTWFHRISAAIFLFISASGAFAQTTDMSSQMTCPNSELLGLGLINKVCWSCMFPIGISLIEIGSGSSPEEKTTRLFCSCGSGLDEQVGMPANGWFPARLIELVRKPYCSPVLGGRTLINNTRLYGSNKAGQDIGLWGDGALKTYKNFHYYAFDLLMMMELLLQRNCSPDGARGMDLLYMGELDPTWQDDTLGFFLIPESVLFGNPIALAACSADCLLQTADSEQYFKGVADASFWCAGCWGGLYPLSGNYTHSDSPVDGSSLQMAKVVAALHRRGLARKTVGNDAQCGGYIYPFLPKSQYRAQMTFPVEESTKPCCHRFGQSTYSWGTWRNIPAVGEDQVYLIWRFTECCIPLLGID